MDILLYTVLVLFGLGVFFGIVLSLFNKYFLVKEDERIAEIESKLPGYNCGACGTAGCHAFAVGVMDGSVKKLSQCRPGKKDINFVAIIKYLEEHPNEDGSNIQVEI